MLRIIGNQDEKVGHKTSEILGLGRKLRWIGWGSVLIASAGCTTYIERPRTEVAPPPPPPPVYVESPPVAPPPPPVEAVVQIRVESDFYEPLRPYGRWEIIAPYGRCWIPARVEGNWRPYSNGHWERTEQGWFWASDESWGWAVYHYGRWDWSPEFGWFWVPQVQWAPAWVSWHQTDGYIGWAPLHPSARFGAGGIVEVQERVIQPRAIVVVETRRFLEPVRPTTVINNTTIINKTVNITNVKVVNNTIINEGPRTEIVEGASGRKVQAVAVRDLRRKSEAQVVWRQPATPIVQEKKTEPRPVVRNQPAPHDGRPPITAETHPVVKPTAATPPRQRQPETREQVVREQTKPVAPVARTMPEPAHREVTKAPPGAGVEKQVVSQHEPAGEKKGQRLAELRPKHELVAKEGRTNAVRRVQKKADEQPKPAEKN